MAPLEKISAAMELIDGKKENLHKSFLDLQSLSPSSLNLTLNWTDIDSYFTALHSSLQHKFHLLQTLNPSDTPLVPSRPELKSLCENMDGLGLRRFIIDHRPDRPVIRDELPDAYRYASDPAAMVLDAMEGFYQENGQSGKGTELNTIRGCSMMMLEELLRVKPTVKAELREKATKMAMQWKQKMASTKLKEDKDTEILGFLLLVGAYGLMDAFSMDELIDYLVTIGKRRQTVNLCRAIIPAEKITDVINKLTNKGMEIAAVRFSIEFGKTDKFPPARLLKEYLSKTKKTVENMHKNAKNLRAHNEATAKEINALSMTIKCIDEYHLESEYPKDDLVKLVETLEKERESRKRAAPATSQQQSKPQQPKLNNRPQTSMQNEQPHLAPPAGMLSDHLAPYHSSLGGSFAGPGPYGANLGFSGNPMPVGSSFYNSVSHPPSAYHGTSVSYGGYEVPPPYIPPYYPQ